MAEKHKDYYKMLGVTRSAGQKEIKSAYRRLAKEHHPDRHHGEKKGEEKFREIKEAYETLIDSEKREKYDAELQQLESLREGAFIDVTQLEDFAFGEEDVGWIDELVNNFSSPLNRLDEDLEILLSKRESREGGNLSVDLPSYFGLGFGFSYSPRRRFNLRIPAGIKNGEIRNIYVPELDFWIRVRFSIG